MLPAAFRRALSAMLLAGGLNAAAAPITATHFGGADYVSVIAVCCGRLGLKYAGSVDGRSLTLRNALHTGSLTAEHREMILDGVRVLLGDIAVARGGQFYVSFADYEHRLRPLFRPDLAVPLPRRPRIIVLDPGHGGVDPGAENKRFHAQEKTFTLDVALRLRPLLLAQGWKVAMTRVRDAPFTNDKARDLEMRAGFAAQWGADVFLSIHFDAAPGDSTRGSEIFSFDPVGQRSSRCVGKADPGAALDAAVSGQSLRRLECAACAHLVPPAALEPGDLRPRRKARQLVGLAERPLPGGPGGAGLSFQ